MKKQVLVATGLFILVGVCALWIYLLVFGVPKDTNDIFADFGFPVARNDGQAGDTLANQENSSTVAVSNAEKLSQLTLRPVAGWQTLTISSTTEAVVYAEQGTGHIYEININTGAEERIDGTTVPGTKSTIFSPDGKTVVFISDTEGKNRVYVRSINTSSEDAGYISTELPPNASNVSFSGTKTLNYTLADADGSAGYEYNLTNNSQTVIFNVPFKEIAVIWSSDGTYLYNKPAPDLRGSLYKLNGNKLASLTDSAYNLVATKQDLGSIFAYTKADIFADKLVGYALVNGEETELPLIVVPEKCTFSNKELYQMWCALPVKNDYERDSLTNWYKGTEKNEDLIWNYDIAGGSATLLDDLTEISGRNIDVDNITTNASEDKLYFRNKNDNTLWLYNL